MRGVSRMDKADILSEIYFIMNEHSDRYKKINKFMIDYDINYDTDLDIMELYLRYIDNVDINKFLTDNLLNKGDLKQLATFLNSMFSPYIDVSNQFEEWFNINKYSKYTKFVKMIEDNFSLNRNIVEIGGGWFPSLAKNIALKQKKIERGTITTFDKNLKVSAGDNIILKKENVERNTDLSDYNLICALNSCTQTDLILELAFKYDKEFIVSLCNCNRIWPSDFISVLKTADDNDLKNKFQNIVKNYSKFFQSDLLAYMNGEMKRFEIIYGTTMDTNLHGLYLYAKLLGNKKDDTQYSYNIIEGVGPVLMKKFQNK